MKAPVPETRGLRRAARTSQRDASAREKALLSRQVQAETRACLSESVIEGHSEGRCSGGERQRIERYRSVPVARFHGSGMRNASCSPRPRPQNRSQCFDKPHVSRRPRRDRQDKGNARATMLRRQHGAADTRRAEKRKNIPPSRSEHSLNAAQKQRADKTVARRKRMQAAMNTSEHARGQASTVLPPAAPRSQTIHHVVECRCRTQNIARSRRSSPPYHPPKPLQRKLAQSRYVSFQRRHQ